MEIALIIDCFLSSKQLEQDNAVAVDIRLVTKTGGPGILRIDVANGAHNICGSVGFRDTKDLCYAKISEMGLEVLVEEYV